MEISLNNKYLLVFLYVIVAIKALGFFYFSSTEAKIFGGGNDADYYHAYAIGYFDDPVNIWPVLLRSLNDIGLYNRDYVIYFLGVLAFFIIPYLVGNLSVAKDFKYRQRTFLFVFSLISLYPSIYFLSLDIYRDVFMIFVFLIGLYVFKKLSNEKAFFVKFIYFILGILIAAFLFKLRPYLGVGYFVALIFSGFYSFKKLPLYIIIFSAFILLQLFYMIGYLEPVLLYREGFGEGGVVGGSNLGIVFDSSITFIPDYLTSLFYQMFGLYFPNFYGFLAFIVESVPFIFAFIYFIRNKVYSNKFVDYLVVFFVSYSMVWVIGNDNLGTASRIRIFNYIVIYIAAFVVYQNKLKSFEVISLLNRRVGASTINVR